MNLSFRRYTHSILLVLLFVSLFLVSCDKTEVTTGPNSGSNGSGSTYFTFKVNGVAMDFAQYNPNGFYYASDNSTHIYGTPGGFSSPYFDLGFYRKATGTFTEANGAWVDYTDANGIDYYYDPSTCSITVTQYGDVGGYIVGTFSAVKHSSNSTATITDGKFSVKRTY
jgi:hypothetical protein